jgi:hypothetical protein
MNKADKDKDWDVYMDGFTVVHTKVYIAAVRVIYITGSGHEWEQDCSLKVAISFLSRGK